MYLYLRKQHRAGALAEASAASDELLALIQMPGNPTKPYYFPLIDRGKRIGTPLSTFWRSPNISGSWSPGSIRRQQSGGWLSASESAYAMPDNHVDLALEQMLYNKLVPALALAAYFLRNDGFVLTGEPTAEDVITGFRTKFDYPPATDDEFSRLFATEVPEVKFFQWFEPATTNALATQEPAGV